MVSLTCLLDTTSPRRPALGVSESWLAKAEPGNNKGTAAAVVEPGKFHNYTKVKITKAIITKR